MSATGKRSSDKLNIIGIVTVGICGAVLTYVSIILLEAFYMGETSQIERQRAFESPSSLRETVRAAHLTNLDGQREGTIAIDRAIELVIADGQRDPSSLVPAVGPSRTPTLEARYGRPSALPGAPADAPPPADGAAPADGGAPGPADPAAPGDDVP
jgi:hypothetical protein